MMFFVGPAAAATFAVDSAADTGDALPGDGRCGDAAGACTPRAAVDEANALAGDDTVVVPAGTWTLGGALRVTDDLAVLGGGAGTTVFRGGGGDSLVRVEGPRRPVVALSGFTPAPDAPCVRGCGLLVDGADVFAVEVEIRGGVARGDAHADAVGGAIANLGGALTLSGAWLHDNVARTSQGRVAGGAIFSTGALLVRESHLADNHADGAGSGVGGTVYSAGSLVVSDSEIRDGAATLAAGGVFVGDGTARFVRVVFRGNRAPSHADLHVPGLGADVVPDPEDPRITLVVDARDAGPLADAAR